jgi:urease accessory protein
MVLESVLGNAGDPAWSERLSAADVDVVNVDQWEAQKTRFRKKTAHGVDVAVSLERGSYIRDGDVLFWDARTRGAIVARIDLSDVMIVHLETLATGTPDVAMRTCVELGHAMGNQHWPAVVKGDRVYVPLVVDRNVMKSVMDTHGFADVRYEFVSGREVVPYLAPHESRRLFGGAQDALRSHHA